MKIIGVAHGLTQPNHIKMFHDKAGNPFKVEIGDSTIIIHQDKRIHEIASSFIVNSSKITLENGGGVNKLLHAHAGAKVPKACMKVPADKQGIRCHPGQATMTTAGKLPAQVLIHTVGCDYRLVKLKKDVIEKKFGKKTVKLKKISKEKALEIQTNAYKNSIQAANAYLKKLVKPNGHHQNASSPVDLKPENEKKLKEKAKKLHPFGISFPTIATNIFEFPKAQACDIAMETIITQILQQQGKPSVKTFHLTFLPGQKEDRDLYTAYLNKHFQA